MLAPAHAPTPDRRSRSGRDGALVLARYLDVILVVASAPFVLLAGLPTFGYALGAGGWIVLRFAAEVVTRRAWSAGGAGSRAALHLTAILGRVWMIAAVLLLARFAGGSRDGITAAVIVLCAFTVELAISVTLRRSLVPGAGGST
jgi:hypothetical protein